MLNGLRRLRFLVLSLSLVAVGCHAQSSAGSAEAGAGSKLSPDLARRVEVMIRSHSEVPAKYTIAIGERRKSEIPGYDQITVTFSADGSTSRPIVFLLSADGKTLAQFNKFDLSADPKEKVSAAGRPGRGGPENAPVLIVGFDDLECPFCAKMHAEMFPALLERYKDQVRVVYRDFPLDQHPWAMRAAIDANCLAGTPAAYWAYVDAVHARAAEMLGAEKNLAKANLTLDKMALDEGTSQKVNGSELAACVMKQDDSKVKQSVKEGEALGVNATPTLFINGEKLAETVPMEIVYRMIDGALIAAGQTPPPPPIQVAPAPVSPTATPAPPATTAPAGSPGTSR